MVAIWGFPGFAAVASRVASQKSFCESRLRTTEFSICSTVAGWYKGRFTIRLSATRHAICDSCDMKLPVASCRKLSQAVAMHLSQKLKKVQLCDMRHATYTNGVQFRPWVHVQCTCIVLLVRVHEDVANMKNIVNRVSLPQQFRKSHVASQKVVL